MADLNRIRVAWANWSGGPGVSTFYFTGTDYAAVGALNGFFDSLKGSVPTGITMTVPGTGDIIDSATGVLTGQWQHGADTVHTGSGTGQYTSGAGLLLKWHTAMIHNGRRLQGHTFLVPIVGSTFGSDGHVLPASIAGTQTNINTLVSSAGNELVVWGRPKAGTGGVAGQITDGVIASKPALLRSRRD